MTLETKRAKALAMLAAGSTVSQAAKAVRIAPMVVGRWRAKAARQTEAEEVTKEHFQAHMDHLHDTILDNQKAFGETNLVIPPVSSAQFQLVCLERDFWRDQVKRLLK